VPLIKSPDKDAISQNISELKSTGKYPRKQQIAIALDVARKAGAKIPFKRKRYGAGISQ